MSGKKKTPNEGEVPTRDSYRINHVSGGAAAQGPGATATYHEAVDSHQLSRLIEELRVAIEHNAGRLEVPDTVRGSFDLVEKEVAADQRNVSRIGEQLKRIAGNAGNVATILEAVKRVQAALPL
jgi:hypothetical protein